MSDIKKIIEEEQNRQKEEERKANEKFRNSKVWQRSCDNDTKAEKLLTFADSAIKKFGREARIEFRYLGTDSEYGSCLACYGSFKYEKTFWGSKSYKTGEVIIGLRGHPSRYGYIASSVLNFGGDDIGAKAELEEITEEWFIRLLAKNYVNFWS